MFVIAAVMPEELPVLLNLVATARFAPGVLNS